MRPFLPLLLMFAATPTMPAAAQQKAAAPAAPAVEDRPEDLFLRARRLERAGRLDDAIAALKKAGELAPKSAEVRAELASLYAREDRVAEALDSAEEALRLDASNVEANRILGSIFAILSEQKRAFRPKDDPARYAERAIGALEKGRGAPGTDLNTELSLGRLYLRAGRWDDAVGALRHIVEQQPQYSEGGMLLAAAQEEAGRPAEAIATLEITVQYAPDFHRAHLKLLELYEATANYPAALATVALLRKAFPDRTAFVYHHAHLLQASGRVGDAERELRALLAKNAADPVALNALGYMLAERSERLEEAVELLQRALKLEPGNPSYLDSLGWAFFKQGKLDQADAPLSEAAQKSPENSVIQDHLGDLRVRQQRFAEAVVAYERALAGDGESIDRPAIEKKVRDARARSKK